MLAVLSDVHANLEALEAVLADAAAHGATQYASLGDVIGFNGDPAACVQRLLPLVGIAVRGNHEQALMRRGLFGVPLYTRMMDLTGAMLPPETQAPLRELPFRAVQDGVTFVHAGPNNPETWPRLGTTASAAPAFGAFTGKLCFFGHTHRATVFSETEMHIEGAAGSHTWGKVEKLHIPYDADGSFRLVLEAGKRYLVNPGSVGQPRDHDPRAAYALYDAATSTVLLRRVAYDIESACPKISRTGLPESFAAALRRGTDPT